MDIPEALSRFVPRHDTLFLRLKQMPAEELTGSAVACALRVLQAEDASLEALERALAQAVGCLEDLPAEHQAEWRRAMQYLLLLIHHRRAPEERDDLFTVVTESVRRTHREEVEQMAVTSAQVLIAHGRREGRKEGREEGREEGLRVGQAEMLLDLLKSRFGPLPAWVPTAIEAMSPSRLREVFHQALDAQTLADLQLEA